MILTNSLIFFVVGFWRSSFDLTFANEISQTSDSQQSDNNKLTFQDKNQLNHQNDQHAYYLKSLNEIISQNLNNKFYHSSKKQSKIKSQKNYPLVVNTWAFVNATAKAWQVLQDTDDRLSAVEAGCSECEELRCDGTVGYGGSPDESGETTLDAVIMDGVSHDAGSIAGLRRIKNAISVARAVMEYTKHTMLVGEGATQFAIDMGFKQADLHSIESMQKWIDWFNNSCQPNFRRNVWPSPLTNCGPYKPLGKNSFSSDQNGQRNNPHVSAKSHDTIGMLVLDSNGNIAGGTSTNGASHKLPGRVGDSPIIGSGVYVDNDVGGACGTGDGDTLMKFLPSYQAVESMRNGMNPSEAAQDAIQRIAKRYPTFIGAIVAIDKQGNHGAACHGIPTFPYSYRDVYSGDVQVAQVPCSN